MHPLLSGLSEQARRADVGFFYDGTSSVGGYPIMQWGSVAAYMIADHQRVPADA
ncbi:hypothetical protein [Pseudomonas sp. NMI542_15]|uniref:hypothetical protein n=1 Tax=Pseudomonas sp. NMI542_15 TaxID=2903148 RepID=UPI001E42EBDC|nr:hypothetical protein [Pseudomonas sp. NMI542_15]MCE0780834.1 hypothetical protein [Pseudomonas sp. NMI542_15]